MPSLGFPCGEQVVGSGVEGARGTVRGTCSVVTMIMAPVLDARGACRGQQSAWTWPLEGTVGGSGRMELLRVHGVAERPALGGGKRPGLPEGRSE